MLTTINTLNLIPLKVLSKLFNIIINTVMENFNQHHANVRITYFLHLGVTHLVATPVHKS